MLLHHFECLQQPCGVIVKFATLLLLLQCLAILIHGPCFQHFGSGALVYVSVFFPHGCSVHHGSQQHSV